MSTIRPTTAPPMTVEQVSELVGDDIAYWIRNPFMDHDAIEAKVCWWVSRAVEATTPTDPPRDLEESNG